MIYNLFWVLAAFLFSTWNFLQHKAFPISYENIAASHLCSLLTKSAQSFILHCMLSPINKFHHLFNISINSDTL